MKNTFTFLLLFLSVKLMGQTYFSFPVTDAIWTYVQPVFNGQTYSSRVIQYGLNGDTIINSTSYHKIYLGSSPFNDNNATYYGAYREDSNKKIWLVRKQTNTEILYYDFSLNAGDNFCFETQPSGLTCLQVDYVDNILINGVNRRQIHFSYGGQTDVWIEGIGSISKDWGGVWSFVGNMEVYLNCYTENAIALYGNCDYPTNIKQGLSNLSNISIYPNPSQNSIIVDILNSQSDNLSLDIYSAIGVKDLSISDFNSKNPVDISGLQNGQYYVVISNLNGQHWTNKIIKNAP